MLESELQLAEGEHAKDALAGIVAIGLKRASLLGRAPVIHDLRIAATIFMARVTCWVFWTEAIRVRMSRREAMRGRGKRRGGRRRRRALRAP